MNPKLKAVLTVLAVVLCVWLFLMFGYIPYSWLNLPKGFYTISLFIALSIISFLFYKALKIKTSFNIKDTEPKYWLWSLLLVVLFIAGDVIIGDPRPIKVNSISVILFFPLFVAFYEEMINRVILLKTLGNAFGFKAALIAQAVIFTVLHQDYRLSAMLYYFLLGGIGMGLLMNPKKGHFFYPLAVHYIAEVVMLAMRM
ncbi:MAG: CPBP family intramembrane metalloprotease [Nanoarchaeota archaeon]|nr:CPBP family intramembrane metalloprotease [Nanoarchaeota archaeon]MBU1004493.1 CPBP family intramembrane metalloprotease [Nanoarchaeota archaeon]MBU1945663.1 CPBP family intramembrane metalloprotease [Nanoarchaeota archaeon]